MKTRIFTRLAVTAILGTIFSTISLGATYTVTKTADTNDGACNADCSLREAIERANQTGVSDSIIFDANVFSSSQIIELTLGGDLNITNDVQIIGTGARVLTVRQTSATARVFDVAAGVNAIFNGLTISGGQARDTNDGFMGGGIRNAGSLNLISVTVCDNAANASGGGIYSSGNLFINRSLFCRNEAGLFGIDGGGIQVTGGTASIANSTISSNIGGGIGVTGGTLNVLNVSIVLNSSPVVGAGIAIANAPTVNVRNSLIGDNQSGLALDVSSVSGVFTSNGNNLVENVTPGIGFTDGVNGDIVGATPLIGPLLNLGGPTDIHPLLTASPAIDTGSNCVINGSCGAVNNATLLIDQRGTGYPRLIGTNVDIGAFEYLGPTAASVSVIGRVIDGDNGIPGVTLTLTALDGSTMYSRTNPFGYFRFDGVEAGQGVVISAFAKSHSFEPILLNVLDNVSDLIIAPRNPTGIWTKDPTGTVRSTRRSMF